MAKRLSSKVHHWNQLLVRNNLFLQKSLYLPAKYVTSSSTLHLNTVCIWIRRNMLIKWRDLRIHIKDFHIRIGKKQNEISLSRSIYHLYQTALYQAILHISNKLHNLHILLWVIHYKIIKKLFEMFLLTNKHNYTNMYMT